jgi:5-carboxyvanillate decarboxylase
MSHDQHELKTGGGRGYKRIATEEAFCPPELMTRFLRILEDRSIDDPGFYSLWGFYGGPSERALKLRERIQDLGDVRLADMDAHGIDMQVISITCPGVQMFSPAEGSQMAIEANDGLHAAIQKHPDRFVGLAAVAPQSPDEAAQEIERCVSRLGFKGVIINSHIQNRYLDDPFFTPVLAATEASGVPLYIHPNTPSKQLIEPFLERGLDGAIFGFGVETGLHVLRLIVSGVFDRFPRLQVVVGHLGEALPFWMNRIDFMYAASVKAGRKSTLKLNKLPSEYLKEHIHVTTSGMPWTETILYCQKVLGMDRVMYAMDYPYQVVADEVREQDNLPISLADKQKFFQLNAERVFSITATDAFA